MNITFTFLESLDQRLPEKVYRKCNCGDPNIIPKVQISGNSDVMMIWLALIEYSNLTGNWPQY